MADTPAVYLLECPACNAPIGEDGTKCQHCQHQLVVQGREPTVVAPEEHPQIKAKQQAETKKPPDWFGETTEQPPKTRNGEVDWLKGLVSGPSGEIALSQRFNEEVALVMKTFFLENRPEETEVFGIATGNWVRQYLPERIFTYREKDQYADAAFRELYIGLDNFEYWIAPDEQGTNHAYFKMYVHLAKEVKTRRIISNKFKANVRTHNEPVNTVTLQMVFEEFLTVRFPVSYPEEAPSITLDGTTNKDRIRWQVSKTNTEWLQIPRYWYAGTNNILTCLRNAFEWLVWYNWYFN